MQILQGYENVTEGEGSGANIKVHVYCSSRLLLLNDILRREVDFLKYGKKRGELASYVTQMLRILDNKQQERSKRMTLDCLRA